MTPIFLEMKGNQMVFNGYGAQETCDMLVLALIHPCMPSYFICLHESLWNRFKSTLIAYRLQRLEIARSPRLPNVSGTAAFRFNQEAHRKFLGHVVSYRRQDCYLSADAFRDAHDLGLFNLKGVIQDDGTVTSMF